MIVNNIKDGNKTILMLGVDYISVALGNLLREYGNSVSFWCTDPDPVAHYRGRGAIIETVGDISDFYLESVDYIIFSHSMFLNSYGSASAIKKTDQIASRAFLAIEIIKDLSPENKFIVVYGKSCRKIICSILGYLFSDGQINVVELPTFPNSDRVDDDKFFDGINLQGNNVFVLDLSEEEVDYLKNLSFDAIAVLDLEKEEQISLVRNFLAKQTKNSALMINVDNPLFRNFQDDFGLANNSYIKTIPISVEKMIENGYSYVNGTVYNYCDSNSSYDLTNNNFTVSDLNRLSMLSSFVTTNIFNLDPATTIASLETFRGLAHNMEYVKHDKNITFVDNSAADTLKLIESPFRSRSNVFAIFIANGRTRGDLVRLKNCRDNIRLSFLIDVFNIVEDHPEEFGSVKVEKIGNIRDALAKITDHIAKENIEDEITVILSPIFGDRMNSVYYSSYGDEFKKLVEGL
jgi:UDP-N-acetylmuramoylalanine-D-glutamate ligase